MKKEPGRAAAYTFDENGTSHVSEQIMNAYNSGVIDQSDGQFDMSKYVDMEDEME